MSIENQFTVAVLKQLLESINPKDILKVVKVGKKIRIIPPLPYLSSEEYDTACEHRADNGEQKIPLKEGAELLGVGERTLKTWINNRSLPCQTVSRSKQYIYTLDLLLIAWHSLEVAYRQPQERLDNLRLQMAQRAISGNITLPVTSDTTSPNQNTMWLKDK
jgi:hypothetical protein